MDGGRQGLADVPVAYAYNNSLNYVQSTKNNQISYSPRPKRPRVDHSKTKLGGVFSECSKIVTTLLNHRYAHPFAQPVNPMVLGIPDYPTLIRKPMDLSTIQKKLQDGEYADIDEFAEDVDLIWDNCERYNGPNHSITAMGNVLRKVFEKHFSQLKKKLADESDGQVRSTLTKQSKKREGEFTLDEKRQLCAAINRLSPGHSEAVVEIIRKSAPHVFESKEGEEEIEISVELLGSDTLRELEEYMRGVEQAT
ncbi:uncharacterized protein LOC126332765 isoform X3 [Schistocerca gregaria]|uniref:uncharacterized protein LOC126332765 isoform X3 n=1 Tax=Schistocerca gregaria TaxID=7010 RepID=UPI00211DF27A|nr:uncharacterized protein LOC126332765 isoform X3 [Schistocerca gregaria]XP_049852610.1 uncharacterized protein LOC126332765 isoform X3 [Schistocerca gregaria]